MKGGAHPSPFAALCGNDRILNGDCQCLVLILVMYKTIFVVNIILHMCLQHSNIL